MVAEPAGRVGEELVDETADPSGVAATMAAVGRAAEANAAFRSVRIEGGIVTRPRSAVSTTVFSYLRHLRDRGLRCVPEPIDLDDRVERLRYLPGASGGDGWFHQHTEQGLSSAARLLRTIHDAGRDWSPPPDAVWGAPALGARRAGADGAEVTDVTDVTGDDTGEIVFCHGDPGPWNFVWHDREAVGLIDWDYLHPAPRTDDVAYALHWFGPLRRDEFVLDWHHFPQLPDRRARVRAFLDAYGGLPGFDVAEAVAARIQATAELVESLARAGRQPQRSWVAGGALEREAAEIAWVRAHRTEFDV